jgi:hypothetical protein
VADGGNNRVLFYPAGSITPTRVYGQNGSFTTGTANNGGISANSLARPSTGLALDSSGNLYVADEYEQSSAVLSRRQHDGHAGLRAGRQLHLQHLRTTVGSAQTAWVSPAD